MIKPACHQKVIAMTSAIRQLKIVLNAACHACFSGTTQLPQVERISTVNEFQPTELEMLPVVQNTRWMFLARPAETHHLGSTRCPHA